MAPRGASKAAGRVAQWASVSARIDRRSVVFPSSSVALKIADAGLLGMASATNVVKAGNFADPRDQEGSAGDLLAGIRLPRTIDRSAKCRNAAL
jgi:hypothetical protein